jgi:hypothetical protein
MPRIRILLDQNAPLGLRRLLSGHDVVTAASVGWSTIQSGDLIRAAEAAGFAVLITCDRNIRYQQNLAGRQARADRAYDESMGNHSRQHRGRAGSHRNRNAGQLRDHPLS